MTVHIFVGKDAERRGITYAALHQLPVVRVSNGVRNAAAVLCLNSTRPISKVWYQIYPTLGLRSCVICDISDGEMLKKVKESRHLVHLDEPNQQHPFQDVELGFQYMEINNNLEGRVGLALRALLVEEDKKIRRTRTTDVLECQLREALKPLLLLGMEPGA